MSRPDIKWHKLPGIKNEGFEVTKHMYSDTFSLYQDGSLIATQENTMNYQGDRFIFAVLKNKKGRSYLSTTCHGPNTEHNNYGWGEYGSHNKFRELVEEMTGQRFEDLLRR